MAPVTYKVKLTRPQIFLWRMSLFLILAFLLAIILDGQTASISVLSGRFPLKVGSRRNDAEHRTHELGQSRRVRQPGPR